jgi:hypothetical protein
MTRRTTFKLFFSLYCLISGTVCLAAASFLSSEQGFVTPHLYEVLATRATGVVCALPLWKNQAGGKTFCD